MQKMPRRSVNATHLAGGWWTAMLGRLKSYPYAGGDGSQFRIVETSSIVEINVINRGALS